MLIYIKLLLTAIFWGGTFIAGKIVSETLTPWSAAFFRFAIASFFLVILTKKIEKRLPTVNIKQLAAIIFLGLTGIFSYNLFFFYGLKFIDAGRASLIIATNPIFICLASVIFFKERLDSLKIAGIALSVSGAVIVISGGDFNQPGLVKFGIGELCICGCVISWVSYSIIGKSVMNGLSPISSVTYSSLAGTALLAIPAFYHGAADDIYRCSAVDWIALLYLGFFGTVLGFFWYYEGIKKIGPVKAGIFINFVPLSAITLSAIILNEAVTPSLFIGGFMVISGAFTTNSSTYLKNKFHKRTC